MREIYRYYFKGYRLFYYISKQEYCFTVMWETPKIYNCRMGKK